MKREDFIVIAFAAVGITFVMLFNTGLISAQLVNLTGITIEPSEEANFSTTSAQENPIEVSETENKEIMPQKEDKVPFDYSPTNLQASYESLKSRNGIPLSVGYIRNNGSNEVKVSVSAFGRFFEAYVTPNQTINFLGLRDMVVAPSSSEIEILAENTTYYEMNDWLKVGIRGKCEGNEILIFTDRAPTRVSSTANAYWNYDSGLLRIHLKSCSEQSIVVDWKDYKITGKVVFIEDMTRAEELSYIISDIRKGIESFAKSIETFMLEIENISKSKANLSAEINQTIEKKNELVFSIDNAARNLTELNSTIYEMNSRITESTIVSPMQAMLIGAIFVALILYIALFGVENIFSPLKKEEEGKNEK